MKELYNTITSANVLYLLIAIGIMILYHLTEAYNLRQLLVAFGERKISIFKALKFTFIGFFFSSITPASTGGQPLEIYYMSKEEISAPTSTISLLVILFGVHLSTVIMAIISGICNPALLKDGVVWLYVIGLLIHIVVLVFLYLSIFSHNITKTIVKICVKLLKFFKIKSVDKCCKMLEDNINKYAEASIYIRKHLGEFIKGILREFVQMGLSFMVPYFIYRALGFNSCSFLELFSMQAILYISVSALPLPGAVGITETVFLKIYSTAFSTGVISASMLLSRGVTFYLFVVISFIVVAFNAIKMKDTIGEIDYQVKELDENEELFEAE